MKDIIDPWGKTEVKDYGKLSKEFGIEPFASFAKKLQIGRAHV